MTYDRNPTDIPDRFDAPAPEQVQWPSHPIAQQIARGLPWLKMHMQAQTKPRKIIRAMNVLKKLATEIYKVELTFIGQIMVYLLRRDADWQARVKHDLGGDKAMRKWWRRFERVQSGEVPQKKERSAHQQSRSYDYAQHASTSVSRGPTTDNDGLFRLSPITGGHREIRARHDRPYRASKPTPIFQPIQIIPADLGFDNPSVFQSDESAALSRPPLIPTKVGIQRPNQGREDTHPQEMSNQSHPQTFCSSEPVELDSSFRWNERGEGCSKPTNEAEAKLQAWLKSQEILIHDAIATLFQKGRRLDAHLFQDWIADLHDQLSLWVKLSGRAAIRSDIIQRE